MKRTLLFFCLFLCTVVLYGFTNSGFIGHSGKVLLDPTVNDEITLTDGTNPHLIKAVTEAGPVGSLRLAVDETDRALVLCDYGDVDVDLKIFDGSVYQKVCTEVIADSKIATHAAIAAAHHARYTDDEAQAAVNLDGNLFHSIAGACFITENPDTDQVTRNADGYIVADADGIVFFAPVSIPQGATVTNAVVWGNAAAQNETWHLKRINIGTGACDIMATAVIATVDDTVDDPVINNSVYSYFFVTTSLDTNDIIYGSYVRFTL